MSITMSKGYGPPSGSAVEYSGLAGYAGCDSCAGGPALGAAATKASKRLRRSFGPYGRPRYLGDVPPTPAGLAALFEIGLTGYLIFGTSLPWIVKGILGARGLNKLRSLRTPAEVLLAKADTHSGGAVETYK